jgi:hypothetical protein
VDHEKRGSVLLRMPRGAKENPYSIPRFDHDVLGGKPPAKSGAQQVPADGLEVAARKKREGAKGR